ANKKYQGKRLSEIAALRGQDAIDTMFDLLVEESGSVDCVYFAMSEDDVKTAMVQPWVAFNCDNAGVSPDGVLGASMCHPRAYGTFPRVLGRSVRDDQVLRLEATGCRGGACAEPDTGRPPRPAAEGQRSLNTSPPFMTNRTLRKAEMSARGLPSTAMTSASFPGSTAPIRSCQPSSSASTSVAAWIALSAGMPASTISSSSRAALAGGNSPASLPAATFSF